MIGKIRCRTPLVLLIVCALLLLVDARTLRDVSSTSSEEGESSESSPPPAGDEVKCPPGLVKNDKLDLYPNEACIAANDTLPDSGNGNGKGKGKGNTRCPEGCKANSCIMSTGGEYMCTDCQGSLIVNSTDGTCGCPTGQYSTGNFQCTDCEKGSFCAGGKYGSTDQKMTCGDGLTTGGKRALSKRSCVNIPGTFFQMDANGDPVAVACPPNSYSPGLKKQRACVPCPPGMSTHGKSGRSSPNACGIPAGFYLKGPGMVAPCPKGEYKVGQGAAAACTKCAKGVTTAAEASGTIDACNVVLPGFSPLTINGSYVASTQACPQKYYCEGGVPSAPFNPLQPGATAGTTVKACPSGTFTVGLGASSADECLTPPGYETVNGITRECADGFYRAEWVAPGANATCRACGDGLASDTTDTIWLYAITPDANKTSQPVRISSSACYARPGQGILFSTASNSFRAVDCSANQYGLPNKTYGLSAFPCRTCPEGMTTSRVFAASAQYYEDYGNGRGGFRSPAACITMPGFGYSGRAAIRCPVGSWNAPGAMGACTQCPYGLSTPDDPWGQMSADNCTLAPGFGFHDNVVVACPVGTYNDILRTNRTAPCTQCPTGLSTAQTGGLSIADCNTCAVGYGGSGGNDTKCDTVCGGPLGAGAYGPPARPAGTPCVSCPDQVTGFSYDYLAVNRLFRPAAVAREQAGSPADCLNEFAQIVDAAWYMGGVVQLTSVPGNITFEACVANCKDDASCQYITYDYDAANCRKKVAGTGIDLLAFKSTVAGDTTAASINTDPAVTAHGLASGSYTFYKDSAEGIGAAVIAVTEPVGSIQACLNLCDADPRCAAAVMTGVAAIGDVPTACSLVRGDTTVGVFKRSVTKTVLSRLSLATVLANGA